ncbi:transposase [Streptomyces coelicoflavus ZG0656]|nr:transposase [Streptomyces coelicoflavus ZG0656]
MFRDMAWMACPYDLRMQLRYAFRVYPDAGQRIALARAFGCARVVFFASLKGTREGPKVGAPRFKSRKDARQSIRFTANARWSIRDGGRLCLPKIGAVK